VKGEELRARFLGAAVGVLVALAGCGSSQQLTDAQLVWCGAHPSDVANAAATLGIPPPDAIQLNAAIAQANLDGNTDLAVSLILRRVGSSITASPDPYMTMDWVKAWQDHAPSDFSRSCLAANEGQ
jgi:hypothetical protein